MNFLATIKLQLRYIYYFIFCILVIVFLSFLYLRYSEAERHQFKVTFLNIGQGDSALIQFDDGEKMLVDCGASKIVLSALGRNLPFYDRTIDYVLATHPDLDHYGGCLDVVKNYHVKEIITNGHEKPDPYWQEWNRVMHESGAELRTITAHEVWDIASTSLEFFSPDVNLSIPTSSADSNNFSIVFRLTHSGKSFLFTGDMEAPLEKILVEKYCNASSTVCPALQSDILKVGHHGSDGASSELFLSFVKPKTAVISVGPNKYGHPTLRAIRHLERAGAQILRTDELGDIVIK